MNKTGMITSCSNLLVIGFPTTKPDKMFVQCVLTSRQGVSIHTPPKINMEPGNDGFQ